MKAFSKEWWFELAAGKSAFWKEVEGFNYPRYLTEEQKFYCAKRYAEAYHREKMKQEGAKLKIANEAAKYWSDVGVRHEQNRILGIIEELSWDETGGGYYLLEKIELIEKIKGYESI